MKEANLRAHTLYDLSETNNDLHHTSCTFSFIIDPILGTRLHTLSGDKVSPKKGYKLFIGTSI